MTAHIDTVAGDAIVYHVIPGSLIVFRDLNFGDGLLGDVVDEIRGKVGHGRFVVLAVNGGDCQVIGPDELIAWLRNALDHHDQGVTEGETDG